MRAAVKGQSNGLESRPFVDAEAFLPRVLKDHARAPASDAPGTGSQILFSNSLMASTSFCWLSAMSLASVIASGCLPELISVWAVVIAP
jgi:hypothetical protein